MENLYTAEGRLLHEKADKPKVEIRGDHKTVCSLMIKSLRLGVSGKADVVEFFKENGVWLPFPVEYKRGIPKANNSDRIQLCAQAICLEEMLRIQIFNGAIFYGKNRRRLVVQFDGDLRRKTEDTAFAVRRMLNKGEIPLAKRNKKCESCSLLSVCMPNRTGVRLSASRYVSSILSS